MFSAVAAILLLMPGQVPQTAPSATKPPVAASPAVRTPKDKVIENKTKTPNIPNPNRDFGSVPDLTSPAALEPVPDPPKPVTRLPVPTEEKQNEAKELIEEIYAKRIKAAKDTKGKLELARQWFDEGRATEDPASRYVLLQMAGQNAVKANDYVLAFQVADELGKKYTVDAVGVKSKIAHIITVRGNQENVNFAKAVNAITIEAYNADRYDVASELASLSVGIARKSNDITLIKQSIAWSKEVDATKEAFASIGTWIDELKKRPDDGVASLHVGKFWCFVKKDWGNGLPLLASCEDAKLKAIAEADLTNPTAATDQEKLADQWWEYADSFEPVQKARIRERAVFWYKRALPELSGLNRAKVENRLNEVSATTQAVIRHYEFAYADYDNTARADNLSLNVAILDGSRPTIDKFFGGAFAAVEVIGAKRIAMQRVSSTDYKKLDQQSFAGFFIDYHTPSGYTSRVAIPVGPADKSRVDKMPNWGYMNTPTKFVTLGVKDEYVFNLAEWAPKDWDGQVIFTTAVQNTGPNTHLSVKVKPIFEEIKEPKQKPSDNPNDPTYVPGGVLGR